MGSHFLPGPCWTHRLTAARGSQAALVVVSEKNVVGSGQLPLKRFLTAKVLAVPWPLTVRGHGKPQAFSFPPTQRLCEHRAGGPEQGRANTCCSFSVDKPSAQLLQCQPVQLFLMSLVIGENEPKVATRNHLAEGNHRKALGMSCTWRPRMALPFQWTGSASTCLTGEGRAASKGSLSPGFGWGASKQFHWHITKGTAQNSCSKLRFRNWNGVEWKCFFKLMEVLPTYFFPHMKVIKCSCAKR